MSLTCDGLTGAVQERMKSESQTKSGHMMRAMNKWSIGFLGIALVATGEIWTFAAFVQRHPSVLGQLVTFSICSALGQVSSNSHVVIRNLCNTEMSTALDAHFPFL